MLDYKEYIEKSVFKQITHDIRETAENGSPRLLQYRNQEEIVMAIHSTLKCFYEDSLCIFMGRKYIHWFAFGNKSVHIKREELFHLTNSEISQLLVNILTQDELWIECDVLKMEQGMPYKKARAMCIECGKNWFIDYSILEEQRTHKCECGNTDSIIVNIEKEKAR